MVRKIILSMLCFAFILVANISTTYAFMPVEKTLHTDSWTIKAYQKDTETGEYKLVYFGYADSDTAKKESDIIIYKDSSSRNNFTLLETKDDIYYLLEIRDLKIKNKTYSHNFEFTIEKQEQSSEENIVTVFDNENNVKFVIRQKLGYTSKAGILY